MNKGLYVGFSSWEYEKNKTFTISDIELVKLDLLNHLFTTRGTRVMMPNFGTRLNDLIFEPLDAITLDVMEEDIRAVIAFDPRVKLLQLDISPSYDTNTVLAQIRLLYVELNRTDTLELNLTFESS